MPIFRKLPGFVEHLALGVHDFGSNQLAVALSNTAPDAETTPPASSTAACVLANVTQIDYSNVSSLDVTTISAGQVDGVFRLFCEDLTLTFSGDMPAFRWVYLYNASSASPDNALLGYSDYGASLSFFDEENLRIDFDGASGVLTIS